MFFCDLFENIYWARIFFQNKLEVNAAAHHFLSQPADLHQLSLPPTPKEKKGFQAKRAGMFVSHRCVMAHLQVILDVITN